MTDLRGIMLKIANQLAGTYINVDGFAGSQCWDSAARVSQLMGLPVINTGGRGRWPGWAGNMWDAFPQSKEIDEAYYRVGPDQPAMPGDKAIWGDSYYYYPATHVADVIADAGGLLLCLSQNSSAAEPSLPGYSTESSGPTIIQHLPKQGLLGYIRPRAAIVLQGGIVTEGEITVSEADRIIEAVNGYTKALLLTGYKHGGRDDNPGLIPHVIENQRLINVGLAENRVAFDALPTRVWWGTTVKRDGKEIAVIQDIATSGTITRGDSEVLVEISENVSPEALAALVPTAQAEAFIAALRDRLAPKEGTAE